MVIVFGLQEDYNISRKDMPKEEEKKSVHMLETLGMKKVTIETERTRRMVIYCGGGMGSPLKVKF